MNAMKEDETPVSSAGSEHPSTKSFQSTDPPPADIPTTTTNVASVSTDKILGIPSTVHSSQALGFANTITTNLLSSSSTTDTAETNAALTNTEQSVDRNTTLCTVTGMMDVTTAIVDKVQADTDIDLTTINTVTTISNTTTTISNTTTTISNTLTVTVDSEASQTKRDTAVAGTAPVMLISEETVTVTIPSAKEVAPVTIPTPGDRDPVTMLTAGERIPVTISSSREAASVTIPTAGEMTPVTIPTAGEMTPVTVPLTGEAASATQAATHTPQITNAKELTIYTAPLSTNTVIKMKEASHTVPTYIDEASVMPLLLTSAAHTSPFPSSSHQAPQTSCTSVEQDDPMEYHNTPQTSKEQGTASTSRNALQLLTSYGISDSEDEECSVDESMDTSCDIGQNETELTNGTAENVATNVCSELPFEGSVPPHSLQLPMPLVEGQCSMPVISEKTFNGGAGTGEIESKEAGDLDVVMTGSYRHTVDVGSDTEDSESDSVSSSLVCDISAVERIDSTSEESTSEESTNEESSSEESATDSKEVEAILQRKKHQVQKKPASKLNILVTPGELQLHELPPIEDLHISVPEEKAVPIGTVFNTVEQQVVVEAFAKIPAIDLDSVLFLDHGKRTLGQVFDVFGPVQEPFYVVRFNSADHIKDNKIEKGDIVYFAPSTEHTNFIVIDELMRLKGSDASGLTGNELPASECQEFSDDEEEARVLGGKKQNKYTTSTNEFQSCRKRGKGQVHGEARDRGHTHENGNNIPFHGRGKVSRPPTRFGYPPAMHPRFRPRGPPPFSMGPPDFIPGSPGFQGPSRMHRNPEPHDPRPFSNFQNRVEMTADQGMALITHEGDGYHNGPPTSTAAWPQPSNIQFGGPPQFSSPRGYFHPRGLAGPLGVSDHPNPPPSPVENSFGLGNPLGSFGDVMQASQPSPSYSGHESVVGMLPPPPPSNMPQMHPNISLAPPHSMLPPQSMSLPPPPPPPPHNMPPPPSHMASLPPCNMPPPNCMPSPNNMTSPPPSHSMPPPPPHTVTPPSTHNMPPPQHNMTPPPPSHSMTPPPLHNITPLHPPHSMPPPPPMHHIPSQPPPPHIPFDHTQAPPSVPPTNY